MTKPQFPKGFHGIPRIAQEELSIYAFRLYGHYCRLDSEGEQEDIGTSAAHCRMSIGDVHRARHELFVKNYISIAENEDVTCLDDPWERSKAKFGE